MGRLNFHNFTLLAACLLVLVSCSASAKQDFQRLVYQYETGVDLLPGSGSRKTSESLSENLVSEVQAEILFDANNERLWKLQASSKDNVEALVGYLHTGYGRIRSFHTTLQKIEEVNFLRGLASLFQYQSGNSEGSEVDVSGECKVQYSSDQKGTKKVKTECLRNGHFGSERLFDVTNQRVNTALFNFLDPSKGATTAQGVPSKVIVEDKVRGEVTLYKAAAFKARSHQKLDLKEQLDSVTKVEGKTVGEILKNLRNSEPNLVEKPIEAEPPQRTAKKANAKNLLASLKKHLLPSKLSTEESAAAFSKLSSAAGHFTAAEVKALIGDKKNKDISAQLMDVLGYLSLPEQFDTIAEEVNQPGKTHLFERYLWSMVQARRKPHQQIVGKLFKLAKSTGISCQKLKQTLTMTLATVAQETSDKELSDQILSWLLDQLNSCTKEDCSLTYLRALKNTNHERTVATLVKVVQESSSKHKKVAVAALKALQLHPDRHFNSKIKVTLETLFSDLTLDSSVRSLSLEILLRLGPSPQAFRRILGTLKEGSGDFASFCVNAIKEIAGRNAQLQKLVRSSTSSGHLNWDLLSSPGLSTSFSRDLFRDADTNVSSSFGFGAEMSGVVFKRSAFQLDIGDDIERRQVLKLEMFAGGLGSYMGASEAEMAADDKDANAGMELTVFGRALRPFVFFSSSSELMGIYWSGQASERNSALQGNMMLQDNQEHILLSNGVVLDTKAQGLLSYDFSGQADISIWDKTTKSTVENAAFYSLSYDVTASGLQRPLELRRKVKARVQLNLETELDFSQDVKICIRMHVLGFPISSSLVQVQDHDLKAADKVERVDYVQGRTLLLNQQNCDLCNKMYPKGGSSQDQEEAASPFG